MTFLFSFCVFNQYLQIDKSVRPKSPMSIVRKIAALYLTTARCDEWNIFYSITNRCTLIARCVSFNQDWFSIQTEGLSTVYYCSITTFERASVLFYPS